MASQRGRCTGTHHAQCYPDWPSPKPPPSPYPHPNPTPEPRQIGGKFYGGYLPVEELARVSKFKPAAAPKALANGAPKAAGKTDDLGIDFATGAPVVRSGADCDLPSGDCN